VNASHLSQTICSVIYASRESLTSALVSYFNKPFSAIRSQGFYHSAEVHRSSRLMDCNTVIFIPGVNKQFPAK
jgi:hypothetical protein